MIRFHRSLRLAGACALMWLALAPAHAQRQFVPPDLILDTADATSGWTGGNTLTRDTQIKVHGSSSLKAAGGSQVRFRKLFATPVDVSTFKYLKFWYYVDRPDLMATTGDTGQIEISSSNTDDQQEWFWHVSTLNLQRGWNFVLLPLPGGVRNGPVDATRIRRIRIYHASAASMTVRIDHVTFSNREPPSFPFAEYLRQKRMSASTAAVEREDDMFALVQRAAPGTFERNRVCRFLTIDLTHRQISSFSLEKIGVARTALDASLGQYQFVKEVVCNQRSPAPGELQRALQLLAADDVAVISSIATLHGVTSEAAAETVDSVLGLDLSRILSTCGGNGTAVHDYILRGVLPPGSFPGANVLVPQCTGTPSQISIRIGTATEPAIVDRGANYRQCMSAFESLGTQCDNPYENPDERFEANLRVNDKLTDRERELARIEVRGILDRMDRITLEDARASGGATHANPNHPLRDILEEMHEDLDLQQGQIEYLEDSIEHYVSYQFGDNPPNPEELLGSEVRREAILKRIQDELVRVGDQQDETFGDICATDPQDPQCPAYIQNQPPPSDDPPPPSTQRCASMNTGDGQNFWFNSPDNVGGGSPFAPRGPQISEMDRVDHCLCQLFDRAYNLKLPGDLAQLPSNCPTPEERIAQKCLDDPRAGNFDIRLECRHLMQPISIDRESQTAKWCKLVRPSCDGYLESDDDCGCGTVNANGLMTIPGCRNGVPNCPNGIRVQDPFGTCGCEPFDSGINQCTPGGKDFYLAMDPANDLKVRIFPDKPGFANKALLVTRPGPVRFVTPGILRSQLPGNGSVLTVNAGLVGNTTDKTGSLKVYCTNSAATAHNRNRLIETIQLSTLNATGPTALSINLNSEERSICYGSNASSRVHFEFSVESAAQQQLAFNDILGDLGSIKPPCVDFPPRPTPAQRPLSAWPASWTLSNGVSVTPKFIGVGTLPPIDSPPVGSVCIGNGFPVPCN